jgi:phage terminase small subunit
MDVMDILNDDMSIKPLSEWPPCWRRTIQGVDLINLGSKEDLEVVLKKIKWPDKIKTLELLGNHTKVQAFSKKVDLTSSDGSMTRGLGDFYAEFGEPNETVQNSVSA